MQLKLLQAKQEETQGVIEKETEEKEKVRETSELFSLPLPVSLLSVSVCLSLFSYFLLKLYCICPPSLAGGKCRAGVRDGRGGEKFGGGALGSESSAEERNKFINNKGDVTSG